MADPTTMPVVISTWPFGMAANAAAWEVLRVGGAALDAVEAGATQCEDNSTEHSVGYGGLPDAAGEVTLDACIMDHRGNCGSVACLYRVRHAAHVARLIMERTKHVMLVGEAATRFAIANGCREEGLLSPEAAKMYEEWNAKRQPAPQSQGQKNHDTLGILALDAHGRLAGACTTSGMAYKLPGRVGDSPIIGAGMYCRGEAGAAAATGEGEQVIKICGSHAVVENMARGMEPKEAIADVLRRLHKQRDGDLNTDVSFVALRADGAVAGLSFRAKTNFRFALFTHDSQKLVEAEHLF